MRIGLVNDLPIAIELLRRVVARTGKHQVAWVATNGREAVESCRRDRPDMILMDLVMPEMGGVEATRRIMADTPCPILLVTASIDANLSGVYDAIGYGALDAVDIPSIGAGGEIPAAALLAKIEMIGRLSRDPPTLAPLAASAGAKMSPQDRLIAIGSSAGGPAALVSVLEALPRDLPASLVLVQHLDAQFVPGFASWLGRHSALPVRAAQEGDRPEPGTVLIAASADHLVFKARDRLGYTPEPRDYVYRPSVDVFFESAARHWPGEIIGVLLTGMGRDGARGLKLLRDKKHRTIAQDRATSAVYGMPKAAVELGAAAEILPLEAIGPRLAQAGLCPP